MRERNKAHSQVRHQGFDLEPQTVRGILGPTNTGKTHFAIERMLGYSSGMIGFPLRLLARENYDRIKALKGVRTVALITGEEKLVPPNARWFVCTVESMPLDKSVEFLAVDEIQLCADVGRGHIFTDRLLYARGRSETIFLGSNTMAPMLRKLIPGIRIDERRRLSTLSYAGSLNLSRLPRRSAIVGFSVNRVYELAERVRRQRGGAAVVLGALSPRTRNAQVAMYEAGEVDYMVATDAIGMGLNLDVNHVAFSGMSKFDGRFNRMLTPVEIGQIAGRAGRHTNNGTFGTTAAYGPLIPEIIEAVESHKFNSVKKLFWRNRNLDFRSPKLLLKSLGSSPLRPEFVRARESDDKSALLILAQDEQVGNRATNSESVRLLWDVCQIPDFRKILPDHHANFLRNVFLHLTEADGQLPEDWVSSQIDRLDNVSGDIESLTGRLANIRTWTYISHRGNWLRDLNYWQGRAGQIEDTLSDVLHERLTFRFVDKRAASIDRKKGKGDQLLSAVTSNNNVIVEGQSVGQMRGFNFIPFENLNSEHKVVLTAARRAAARSANTRVKDLLLAPDNAFHLSDNGNIVWANGKIGKLVAGPAIMTPELRVVSSNLLDNKLKCLIHDRLKDWLGIYIKRNLRPLTDALVTVLGGAARGVVYRLYEHSGALPTALTRKEWQLLQKPDKINLNSLGVRITPAMVYMPALQSIEALWFRRILWATYTRRPAPQLDSFTTACSAGPLSRADWACLGFMRIKAKAIRFDRLDKLLQTARRVSQKGYFVTTPELTSIVELNNIEFKELMEALGYSVRNSGKQLEFYLNKAKLKQKNKRNRLTKRYNLDSPFASLRDVSGVKLAGKK